MKAALHFAHLLALMLFVLVLYSCSESDEPIIVTITNDGDFSLSDANGTEFNSFQITDNDIRIYIPHGKDLSAMTIPSSNSVDSIEVNGVKTTAINKKINVSVFTEPVRVLCKDKLWRTIVVFNLPVLIIETPGLTPITSKETRIEGCCIKLITNEVVDLGTAGIRGRGGSSWEQPKKPYNIKLDKKSAILGMNSSKHWILLANAYYDRTQLHNATAFEIARLLDFPWVQEGRFVELILNGEHQGLYYLSEKIRAEKDKINLNEAKEGTDVKDCGYLLESYVVLETNALAHQYPSNYIETDLLNSTGYEPYVCRLGWEIKEPEDNLTKEHISYIYNQLLEMERMLMNSDINDEYRKYFDIETAINWWITEEITINDEASRSKNMYIYKNGDGKFTVGPPWDFDAWTFGSDKGCGFSVKDNSPYYRCLFRDSFFVNRLKEKWVAFMPILQARIPDFIENEYILIENAARRNELLWTEWHPAYDYPNKTYRQVVDDMKRSFISQLEWMDQQIITFTNL